MRIKSLFALPLLAALSASGGAQPQSVIAPLFAADPGTRAVLLIENGRAIAKRYAPGFSDANRFISSSTAKTVPALPAGSLAADGSPAPSIRRALEREVVRLTAE